MLDDEESQSITSLMHKGEGELFDRAHVQRTLLCEYERVTGFHETTQVQSIITNSLSMALLALSAGTFAHAQCESMRIVHASSWKADRKKERAKARP
jgi:hypothetical protein